MKSRVKRKSVWDLIKIDFWYRRKPFNFRWERAYSELIERFGRNRRATGHLVHVSALSSITLIFHRDHVYRYSVASTIFIWVTTNRGSASVSPKIRNATSEKVDSFALDSVRCCCPILAGFYTAPFFSRVRHDSARSAETVGSIWTYRGTN